MMYNPPQETSFYNAVDILKEQLRQSGSAYRMMNFKGIIVTVSVDSNPDDLATIYDLRKKYEPSKESAVVEKKSKVKFGPTNLADHYTCYYCGLAHKNVEAGGMWHCPNIACSGPGGGYYRSKLKGTTDEGSKQNVDMKEWRNQVLVDMKSIKDDDTLEAVKESLKTITAHVASDKYLK